jgi:methionyl-tRNA formyltransferase
LQHTILAGEKFTGVTLQTLDDQSFDKGIILAQERYKINSYKTCTYTDLLEFITPSAVEVLVKGLQCRLFVPPLVGIASSVPKDQLQYIRNAPKITPQDKEIHSNWRGTEILRRYRALGRLWINVGFDTKVTKRIIFEDFSRSRSSSRPDFGQWGLIQRNAKQLCTKTTEVEAESESSSAGMMESEQTVHFVVGLETGGRAWPLLYIEEGDAIIMQAGSEYLRVNSITVEGQGKKAASKALQSLRNYAVWTIEPLSGEQGVVSATPQFSANK